MRALPGGRREAGGDGACCGVSVTPGHTRVRLAVIVVLFVAKKKKKKKRRDSRGSLS